jgi:hypothetical protein
LMMSAKPRVDLLCAVRYAGCMLPIRMLRPLSSL